MKRLSFIILVIMACTTTPSEPEFDNPIIPDDPNFVAPSVEIVTGPTSGSTIDTCMVALAWRGNQDAMEYAVKLDDAVWSNWSTDSTIQYDWLDEGTHTFSLKCRYSSGVEGDTTRTVNFIVDDIQGPALWFKPRNRSTAWQNGSYSVEIMLEDVTNLMAVKAELEFDASGIGVTSIDVYNDASSLLKSNGGTIVSFKDYSNIAGTITIDLATATGSPAGVSGSGAIARITFSGTTLGYLRFLEITQLRDPDNANIDILELAGGQ